MEKYLTSWARWNSEGQQVHEQVWVCVDRAEFVIAEAVQNYAEGWGLSEDAVYADALLLCGALDCARCDYALEAVMP